MTILDRILHDVHHELAQAKAHAPLREVRARIPDLPPPLALHDAIAPEFCLIAEIKASSPSVGKMRPGFARGAVARLTSICRMFQKWSFEHDPIPNS